MARQMESVEEVKRRKGKDRNVKLVMKATGASYSTALTEVRRRSNLGELRVYMMMINSQPEWMEGQAPRCVRCLLPVHGRCAL